MEELQDAIEDAQYVNAISTEDGPRPMLPWILPSDEELDEWKKSKQGYKNNEYGNSNDSASEFSLEWVMKHPIGFFMFAQFVKKTYDDYVRLNFIESTVRYRKTRARHRCDKAKRIVNYYLKNTTDEESHVRKKEIVEYDIARTGSSVTKLQICSLISDYVQPLGLQAITADSSDIDAFKDAKISKGEPQKVIQPSSEQRVNSKLEQTSHQLIYNIKRYGPLLTEAIDNAAHSVQSDNGKTHVIPGRDIFDKLEAVVFETLKTHYFQAFLQSVEYTRLLNFLWYEDRRVVEEDFFILRVLGRGGFGLVTGCRKGTSGKLYAMKVMNKKRIKIKKSEQLTLNERMVLAAVNSPFVVNLKYSFQSKTDVFLILDLMTGGDLSFHLSQKGFFPKKECLYYGARILLGLQALHDKNYVYRDLKPENCLLADDGRVKLTDLGLACRITSTLHGAAGTRGYWAPEMLRRDKNGKRMPYGHTVDWFSFGCLMAEFISGTNPFRSEASLNFGLGKGKKTKEKAIDCATLEMDPVLLSDKFDVDAADLCRKLLEKDETTRIGVNGCDAIMAHPWFKDVNWELITSDRKKPPFTPAKDVNALTQREIGQFTEDKVFQETVIDEKDDLIYKTWNWTNPTAYAAEVIEFLVHERDLGRPLLPIDNSSGCCCTIS